MIITHFNSGTVSCFKKRVYKNFPPLVIYKSMAFVLCMCQNMHSVLQRIIQQMNNSLRGMQCTDDKRKYIPLLSFTKASMTEEERIKTRGTPGTKQSPEWDERKILKHNIKSEIVLF